MAHYAQLDGGSNVLNVVVIADSDTQDGSGNESESVGIAFCKSLWGSDTNWKRTSLNTRGNTHIKGGTPFRKNYANVGGVYDVGRDAFYPDAPYASWILNETTCTWEAPTADPAGPVAAPGEQKYYWDEPSTSWKAVP